MTKMIDYEDNVFFITERTKLLEKGMALSLDPALFADRFQKDAEFISRSLRKIRIKIDRTAHAPKRPEYFRALMLANQRFVRLLGELLKEEYVARTVAEEMLAFHEDQVNELGGSLDESVDSEKESELISSQEFEFLLMESGEEE